MSVPFCSTPGPRGQDWRTVGRLCQKGCSPLRKTEPSFFQRTPSNQCRRLQSPLMFEATHGFPGLGIWQMDRLRSLWLLDGQHSARPMLVPSERGCLPEFERLDVPQLLGPQDKTHESPNQSNPCRHVAWRHMHNSCIAEFHSIPSDCLISTGCSDKKG